MKHMIPPEYSVCLELELFTSIKESSEMLLKSFDVLTCFWWQDFRLVLKLKKNKLWCFRKLHFSSWKWVLKVAGSIAVYKNALCFPPGGWFGQFFPIVKNFIGDQLWRERSYLGQHQVLRVLPCTSGDVNRWSSCHHVYSCSSENHFCLLSNCVIRTQWEALNCIQFALTYLCLSTGEPDEERVWGGLRGSGRRVDSSNISPILLPWHRENNGEPWRWLITLVTALHR